MSASFFFYDLETSGFNPRRTRIMQFAGQRTDLELRPIGEPHDFLIQLSDDVLPDPDAILITGITPQLTRAEGITEAEFLKIFTTQIATEGTIFTGFNTIRFDDEFMRYLHYRNFYDPYQWQWQEGRSKWDLLDVVRMTRALRPDGIKWPFSSEGKPSNRLELLTGVNKLEHTEAHNALSDVNATIAVARLVYNKQTKLFNYLLKMRDKKEVAKVVDTAEPFVYTSGKYPSQFDKTTIAVKLADHPKKQGALVYDLRHDPAQYRGKTPTELADMMRWTRDETAPRLPVKTLQANRCPAVAPLSVLDETSQKRLQLDMSAINKNLQTLKNMPDFAASVLQATELLAKEQQTQLVASEQDVDAQLYDGFFERSDQITISAIRACESSEITSFADKLHDPRLTTLLPLYKARNFPKQLTDEERQKWETYRTRKLTYGGESSRMFRYFTRLQELSTHTHLTHHQQFLLEELRLYGESIIPVDTDI